MTAIPADRPPTHPGEMIIEKFLNPVGLTPRDLAEGIRVPYPTISEIVNGRECITAGIALRLAKFFRTSEEFWLNGQMAWDIYYARISEAESLSQIKPRVETKQMHNEFSAVFEQDDDWYIAYCLEIPGANSQGKTKDEARANLAEAIELILEYRRESALRGVPPGAIMETIVLP